MEVLLKANNKNLFIIYWYLSINKLFTFLPRSKDRGFPAHDFDEQRTCEY